MRQTTHPKNDEDYDFAGFDYEKVFAKDTYYSNTFINNNNYVNTQVLKGKTTTTRQTITLSEILKSFVKYSTTTLINDISYDAYYAIVEDNIKKNLLDAIDNASIGAKSDSISSVSTSNETESLPTNIAKCTLNNSLISFENILNVDEIIWRTSGDNGLFRNEYGGASKYVIPDKSTSKTRYYPEIIVNINIA